MEKCFHISVKIGGEKLAREFALLCRALISSPTILTRIDLTTAWKVTCIRTTIDLAHISLCLFVLRQDIHLALSTLLQEALNDRYRNFFGS